MIRFGTLDWGVDEQKAIQTLISQENPQLTLGKKVFEFERKFAGWLNVNYAVMVNSGTSALVAAIKTLQFHNIIDRLYVPALTYAATWNALKNCHVNYAVKDVNNGFVVKDFNWHNKFLSVDLLGKPSRVHAVIDDACEAMGSKLKGEKMGTTALIGVFSFYVAHIITTVEGGMAVTNDKTLYETLRMVRDNGRICTCPVCALKTTGFCRKRINESSIERRWDTKLAGFNFKPTEFQGVLGIAKMSKIDEICARRHEIFKIYEEELGDLKEEVDEYIVPLAYPVKVKDAKYTLEYMNKQGIECRGMFPAYSTSYRNAYRISQECILVPTHQDLSDADVYYIIEKVREV